jgi:hypothetical protein
VPQVTIKKLGYYVEEKMSLLNTKHLTNRNNLVPF